MVYEIYFEPKGAVWRIRITTFYLGFIPCASVVYAKSGDTGTLTPMDFATFDEAHRYTNRVGLGNAYQRRERCRELVTQIQGVGAHGSSS